MNRSRLEPLGVPGTDCGYAQESDNAERKEPSALDRWLMDQMARKLGESPVRITLWDEPDVAPRDGPTVLRILDRQALIQLAVNPDDLDVRLQLGVQYSSAGQFGEAMEEFVTILTKDREHADTKRLLLDTIAVLGKGDPLAVEYQRKLYSLLY